MNQYNIQIYNSGGAYDMKEYTYFNSKLLYFNDENNKTIMTPNYVKRAAKNYRFNHAKQILQKKCIECGKYYDVQQYRDGKFSNIHDEMEIHFYSEESGYATRCVACNDNIKTTNNGQDNEESTSLTDVYLTEENLFYIRIVAVLENKNEQECMNSIIDLVRKHNTLSYDYIKKIK